MIYLSDYYINLSKVHLGPCTYAFFHGRRTFQTVCNIWSYDCQRRPTWCWSERRIILPYLSCCVQHSWHMPSFWLFSFTRCIVQHLGLSEKSQGICSFLGGSTSACCVQHFLEEAPKLLENPMSLSVQYVLSPSYLLGVLRSCIWVDSHLTALLWWSFCGLFLIP